MPFVNEKLGNAFRINSIDSTRDNEHYFGGYRKTVVLQFVYMSGNSTLNKTSVESSFALTGSTTLPLSQSVYDSQNYLIVRGAGNAGFDTQPPWFKSVFGIDASGSTNTNGIFLINPQFSCQISSSVDNFNLNDIDITIPNGNSIKPFAVVSEKADSDGYFSFAVRNLRVLYGNDYSTAFTNPTKVYTLSCSTGKTYVFKNVKTTLNVFVTSEGVKFFKDNDNQNQEFGYINVNVMPKVE